MQNSWNSTGKFDREALQWDEKPQRRILGDAVAKAMIRDAKPHGSMRALEIGCGTGLVSLAIAPLVMSLSAIDTSREMLEVLEYKTATAGIRNIRAICSDLGTFSETAGQQERFDLIYCSMTLHHIEDTASFIAGISRILCPGGIIAIADLETEDGLFHDDPEEKVHHGFDRIALAELFRRNGLQVKSHRTIHVISKTNREGRQAEYPVFLATATAVS